MKVTRRDLLKLLLASAVAEAVDVEKLLWTPKAIVTVPGTWNAMTRSTVVWWRNVTPAEGFAKTMEQFNMAMEFRFSEPTLR